MTQIMLLQSIYAVAVIILELPTGAVADYFGKRISLVFGSLFFSVGLFAYGASFTFWQFAGAETIVALGMALISGADRAFIHETLKSLGKDKKYKKVEGKARGLTHIARAVGNIGGGLIGSIALAFSLIATGISTFIAFLVGISFAETKVKVARKEKTEYLNIITDSLKIVKNNETVLWLVLFFALFNSLGWTVNWFAQPYLQMLNVPIVYFGIIFAAFSIISAIGSSLVDQFEKVTGSKPFLVMSIVTGIVMFLVGRFPSIYIFPLWSLFGMFMVINQTLTSEKILALIPSGRAATVLSFANLVRRFTYAAFGPILG